MAKDIEHVVEETKSEELLENISLTTDAPSKKKKKKKKVTSTENGEQTNGTGIVFNEISVRFQHVY
jgi:hypothetical protein